MLPTELSASLRKVAPPHLVDRVEQMHFRLGAAVTPAEIGAAKAFAQTVISEIEDAIKLNAFKVAPRTFGGAREIIEALRKRAGVGEES